MIGDHITIGAALAALAALCLVAAPDAEAQTLGTYTYASGRTTGTMTVTDMSACQRKDALGCMSAARPLRVSIHTINGSSGNDCDLDAVEETAGRIGGPGGLKTMLVIEDDRSKGKPNLSIAFAKGVATVEPQDGGDGIGCGAGVGYGGRWRLKGR